MKNIKKLSYYFLPAVFASLVLLATPHLAQATSKPVGLNQLIIDPGPDVGQVTLHWVRFSPTVDNYTIWYGTSPGNYQYAAGSIGNTVTYTIGYLQPGVRYYFLIQGYSQGTLLPLVTPELSAVAASAPATVIGTAGPYGQRQLTAVSGPTSGQVTLTWLSVLASTTNFSVVYGKQPGVYLYGALNIAPNALPGSTQTFTVGALDPGQRYYFAVVPMQSGQGIYSSGEVSQVAHW